jgi:hypothetical protein
MTHSQFDFATALLDPTQSEPAGLTNGRPPNPDAKSAPNHSPDHSPDFGPDRSPDHGPDGAASLGHTPAGSRFDVYRNNVAVSLTDALHQGFPILAKLLGSENMNGLAGLFLRSHPPTTPLMMHYGAKMPAFLGSLRQLAHLPYLADIARLEIAIRRSYHAMDHQPATAELLGQIATSDLMTFGLTIAPSAQIVRSEWPLWDIWRFNTEENPPPPAVRHRLGWFCALNLIRQLLCYHRVAPIG